MDYWARTGLLRPSAREAAGRGTRRAYTFADLVAAMTIRELRNKGCSLQTIRKVITQLRRHFPDSADSETLARLTLLTDGRKVYLLRDEHQVMEILTKQHVWGIALGLIIREARRKVDALPMEWTELVKVRGRPYHLIVSRDREEGGFSVQCRELPGALEQGESDEEAVANGKAAIESVLDFQARRASARRGKSKRARSAG